MDYMPDDQIPPVLKRILAASPVPISGPAPTLNTTPAMTGAMPRLPDAAAPAATMVPNERDLLKQNTMTDAGELNRLKTTGSGIDQIHSKPLRVAARIGDGILSALLPNVATIAPGTTFHHNMLIGQAENRLGEDQGAEKEQAATTLLDAQPQLKQMGLENQTLKIQNLQQHQQDVLDAQQEKNKQTYLANLRNHGYAPDETDPTGQKTRALRYEEMSEQQQAVADLNHAREEQAEANAALKKAQNDPTSPAFRLAKQRADAASQNANTAVARLSRQDEGLAMRREMMNANLYGMGADGKALAGSAQIMGDDGQMQTVGLRAASNAIKQQKAAGTFNDLVGSVKTTRSAMDSLHNAGGSFADAGMIAAMNDPHSMVGKYVQGKLVKGNLNDTQIQALGAVNQLREQIGILRSSTGGTAAEAQAQRMLDTLPTAGDSPAIVRNKLSQVESVLQRLSPSVTGVKGGLSIGGRGLPTPKSGPKVGDVEDGHRFKGGDPASPNSWELVTR